jgi:hypothetical protein
MELSIASDDFVDAIRFRNMASVSLNSHEMDVPVFENTFSGSSRSRSCGEKKKHVPAVFVDHIRNSLEILLEHNDGSCDIIKSQLLEKNEVPDIRTAQNKSMLPVCSNRKEREQTDQYNPTIEQECDDAFINDASGPIPNSNIQSARPNDNRVRKRQANASSHNTTSAEKVTSLLQQSQDINTQEIENENSKHVSEKNYIFAFRTEMKCFFQFYDLFYSSPLLFTCQYLFNRFNCFPK